MEWTFKSATLYTVLTVLFPLLTLFLLLLRRRSNRHPELPPGPRGWPVFGYIFSLGQMPHRTLYELREKYGPVVWLKIGSKGTMVILSSSAATELFRNHDLAFSDRSIPDVSRAQDYYKGSFTLAPYGPYWRALKRILTAEMFVNKRLNESAIIREKCVGDMLSWIDTEAKRDCGVHVARFVYLGAFNVMGNLLFSRDLVGPQSQMGSNMYTATMELMELSGTPNISDLFPWLRWFDIQGLRRKMGRSMGKALEICSSYVEERLKEHQGRERISRKDFLEVLLDYKGNGMDEPAKLSKHEICVFLLDIIFGGTETISSTVEWALTELIRKPEAMNKVRAELAKVVGPNKRFEERDIDNLPYLQALIKETLRLHPPVPFLIPRRAIPKNTNFMGHKIPRNTQVFVNAWAIGRDPECWDEPLCFKPERFLGSSGLSKGQYYEMVPFGGGRRNCPGIPLAQRMVPLILGSLIHEFEWELEETVTRETMDMREKLGTAITKLQPLKVIPKKIVYDTILGDE